MAENHPFDWHVESSREIVRDDWIGLRADSCRMPDGRLVEPYYVLDYSNWVSILALTPAGEVVMVRQYRHGVGGTILELPCGRVDDSDASPMETAVRELREETGYAGESFVETGVMYANATSHTNNIHTFAAQHVELAHKQTLDYSEEIEVVLVPLPELIDLLTSDTTLPSSLHATVYNGLRAMGKLTFQV